MRAVVVRELAVIARRPALAVVMFTYVTLLGGFVFAWDGGVPVSDAPNLYGQTRLVQWGLLALLLPWTAARCLQVDRGDGLALTAALTALRPSSILTAKTIALFAVLTLVSLTGLPVALIAQQMAAIPVSLVVRDTVSLLGLPLLVSAVTVSWMVKTSGRVCAWLGASISVGVVLLMVWSWRPAGLDVGSASALVALAVVAWLSRQSDSTCLYLSEWNS